MQITINDCSRQSKVWKLSTFLLYNWFLIILNILQHELLLLNTTTMTALHSWSDIKVEQFQLLETKKIKNQR